MSLGTPAVSAAARPHDPLSSPRLPDQVTIQHGPRDLLSAFFLVADRLARERGVRLSVSTDFDELLAVNRANRASWESLLPAVDPRYHRFVADAAFWLRGVDAAGRVVLTRACRRVDLGSGNLHDELTSLRLFYDPRIGGGAPDELLFCDCPSAHQLHGLISFQAGGWHHPDYRSKGLSAISSRIVKALALTMWDVREWISLVDDPLVLHLLPAYGVTTAEPGIEWRRYGETVRMHMLRMTVAELLPNLTLFLQRHGENQPHGAA